MTNKNAFQDRYSDASSLDPHAVRNQLMSAQDIHPERFVEVNSPSLQRKVVPPVTEGEETDSEEEEEIHSPGNLRDCTTCTIH